MIFSPLVPLLTPKKMPLIVITGYPCSGKTYRAQQLVAAFEDRITSIAKAGSRTSKYTVVHIPSHHSSTPQVSAEEEFSIRDSIYNSAALEKTARAAELSAIKRVLSKDAIVIADDLNYIKGFRYQLWCEAKAAGTRCCTIHCAAREDEVESWNRGRLRQWAALKGEVPPDEVEGTAAADGHVQSTATTGVSLPESHTALYGDRIPDMSSRSRSSSMDADNGEDAAPLANTLMEESLRSFSLADRGPILMAKPASPDRIEDNIFGSCRSAETPAIRMFDFSPPSSAPYSPNTLQSLLMRYEPPSPFSRWDTPLFTIPASDSMPPLSAIWDAIFPPQPASTTRKGGITELKADVKPNAATVLPQATEADALQTLERITADVVAQIIGRVKEHAELGVEGGDVQIRISGAQASLSIPPGTILSVPMLQRLRRRYTQIQRGGIAHRRGHVHGEVAVGEAFVRFLNGEMGN